MLDCALIPGPGGDLNGSAGSPSSGTGLTQLSGNARRLQATLLSHDEMSIAITVEGQQGDIAFAMVSGSTQYTPSNGLNGVLQIALPGSRRLIALGIIPSSGILSGSVTRPLLPPAFLKARYFVQGLFQSAAGSNYLSGANFAFQFNRDGAPDCDGNGVQDFVDVAVAPISDCNHSLFPDSCDIANGTSTDLNGNGVPDECDALSWYVQASAPAGGNGSLLAPFQTLQQGIAAALSGHEVVVLDGTYTGASNRELNFSGRDIHVRSQNGMSNCIIDCQGLGRAFRFVSSHEPATASVAGFTIRNGSADHGGGVEINGSDVAIDACFFDNCSASLTSGALRVSFSKSTVANCTIAGCSAGQVAGAISALTFNQQVPRIVGCTFANNFAPSGGALYAGGCYVSHCAFLSNSATDLAQGFGGAIDGGGLVLDNCLLAGNSAGIGGGALSLMGGGGSISNCTFVDNRALVAGGALRTDPIAGSSGPTTIANSVFRQNSAPSAPQIRVNNYGSSCSISYSDIDGGQNGIVVAGGTLIWGAGNLNSLPLFSDADGPDNNSQTIGDNDYRLSLGSPCLDAGNNAAVAADFFDLDGDGNVTEPSPVDLVGALRFVDIPSAPDTGLGTPPLVDIGCFELP